MTMGKVVIMVCNNLFNNNNQYSFLVELLCVSIVMFARERLVKKRLLLRMSSDFKTKNGRREADAHHIII